MERLSVTTGDGVVTNVTLDDGSIFIHSSKNENATVQHMVEMFSKETSRELERKLEIYKFIGKDAKRSRLIVQMLLQDRERKAMAILRKAFERTVSL